MSLIIVAILFLLVIILVVRKQNYKQPNNRPWIYHDWGGGSPAFKQKKKIRSLKKHINKRK